MGTDDPDVFGNVRVYGDGKFRNTMTPTGMVTQLVIEPALAVVWVVRRLIISAKVHLQELWKKVPNMKVSWLLGAY